MMKNTKESWVNHENAFLVVAINVGGCLFGSDSFCRLLIPSVPRPVVSNLWKSDNGMVWVYSF